ncbi:MAG: CPBP family intramembrane glutamic endopeptidase [Hyphomicrobiales bacterium]
MSGAPWPDAGSPPSERAQLIRFFALTLIAWTVWGPQAAHRLGLLGWTVPPQSPLNLITVWAPGLAAMGVAWRVARKQGVSDLWVRLRLWRVPAPWYVFALCFEPLRWLLALAIDRLTGQSYPLGGIPIVRALGPAAAAMAPVALLLTLPNALGEELGWRAFALPRLMRARGPLVASVILGLFWGLWHVPMWIAFRSAEPSLLPIALLVASMVPFTVLFTWLWLRTGGSLLLVCFFHASSAMKGYLLPKLPTLTEVAVLWIVAAAVSVVWLRRDDPTDPMVEIGDRRSTC